uniref:dTDP-4-dehydrorhamnose 3,5-epimerase n=1 Tax=uncultured bacterium CSL1 TaxID=1091565 RepID=G4WV98_9BACT|nr:dTDP-4-dehydrorhamnose 3,5-epimerase [uncultured bacterium CSL1]
MQLHETKLSGVRRIELKLFGDARGFFVERFNAEKFADAGLPTNFVQDNHSRSAPGILRGLHYQTSPAQGKLVGVIRGSVLDVVADIRPESPTFGQHIAVEMTGENGVLLWVPPGFAHGFCVLGDEPVDMLYKVTALYNPQGEGGVSYNDPELAIDWPLKNPTISARDQALGSLDDIRRHPPVWQNP